MSFTLLGVEVVLGWREWLAISLALAIIVDVAAMRMVVEAGRG